MTDKQFLTTTELAELMGISCAGVFQTFLVVHSLSTAALSVAEGKKGCTLPPMPT